MNPVACAVSESVPVVYSCDVDLCNASGSPLCFGVQEYSLSQSSQSESSQEMPEMNLSPGKC